LSDVTLGASLQYGTGGTLPTLSRLAIKGRKPEGPRGLGVQAPPRKAKGKGVRFDGGGPAVGAGELPIQRNTGYGGGGGVRDV